MNEPTVTLIDGRTVSTSSAEWRDECLTRHKHVMTMRRLDRPGRHDYVQGVRRTEGDIAGNRLVQAYGDDFERRKADRARLMAEAVGPGR